MILPWNLRRSRRAAARRRRLIIAAGHAGNVERARQGLLDPDPDVQAAALGALARIGVLTVPDIARALANGAAPVRRRATDAALSVRGRGRPARRSTTWSWPLSPIPTHSSSWARPGSWPSDGWPGP